MFNFNDGIAGKRMNAPIKGPLKRRFDKASGALVSEDGTATIVWWTKSRGQVVRNGTLLKQFESQEELVRWMEKAGSTTGSEPGSGR